jgi:hypothetical protein
VFLVFEIRLLVEAVLLEFWFREGLEFVFWLEVGVVLVLILVVGVIVVLGVDIGLGFTGGFTLLLLLGFVETVWFDVEGVKL